MLRLFKKYLERFNQISFTAGKDKERNKHNDRVKVLSTYLWGSVRQYIAFIRAPLTSVIKIFVQLGTVLCVLADQEF